MIPSTESRRLVTSLENPAHAFQIEMTPQMAKLLSSQTYSNKLLAAIREPLSNAYDSHIRAGTLDLSVDLHLPTAFEPWFALRDYGTGLTHDDVVHYFFSYGRSDKRQTNDELGGLGIGAKSFFAYTDTCTITAWKDGEESIFQAYKTAEGLPAGTLVSHGKTAERNGVEIRFPVDLADSYNVVTHVQNLLQYLPLKVNCNRELDIPSHPILWQEQSPIATLQLVDRRTYSSGCIIMGGLAYSIPSSMWTSAEPACDRLRSDAWPLVNIHLPIGAIEISASRETLSPTAKDMKLFSSLVRDLWGRLQFADWYSLIDQAPTYRQALRLVFTAELFTTIASDKVTWRGQALLEGSSWREFVTPDCRVLTVNTHRKRRAKYNQMQPISLYREARLGHTARAAFWHPTTPTFSVSQYYQTREMWSNFDLHLVCASEAVAQDMLDKLGYPDTPLRPLIEIKNKTAPRTLNAKPRAASVIASYDPDQPQTVWLNGRRCIEFVPSKWLDWLIIDSSRPGVDTDLANAIEGIPLALFNGHRPHLFRPIGMPADPAAKIPAFAGLPRSLADWLDRNIPTRLNREYLQGCMEYSAAFDAWSNDHTLRMDRRMLPIAAQYLKHTGFPVSAGRCVDTLIATRDNNYMKLVNAADPVDVDVMRRRLDDWFDSVYPTLPESLRNCLCWGQVTDRAIARFDLFREMTQPQN